jgi:hypothetical protein
MIKFEFNHHQKSWDRYHAFHATNGPFTEFETGELMVTYTPKPGARRTYAKYGIQLVTTADKNCPQLYLDKACTQPVPPAWVTQGGQQHLAVDLEQKVATALRTEWGKNKKLQYLGKHVEGACALWTGPNRLPVPLAQITVSTPDRSCKRELKDKLDAARAAITAVARMQGLPVPWGTDRLAACKEWVDLTVEEIVAKVLAYDKILIRYAAFNGFSYPRNDTKHDFLYIK